MTKLRKKDLRRRQAEMQARWSAPLGQRREWTREQRAFRHINCYLAAQRRRMDAERRYTALYSIPSTWQAVEFYGRYFEIRRSNKLPPKEYSQRDFAQYR